MNSIFIVMPILILLMFDLGLTLRTDDFRQIAIKPNGVVAGMLGQIVVLPLLAFAVAYSFQLPELFFVGMMLIACCPGGSSSNVFSMLIGGDVALSVSLTALSSFITLVTLPLVMDLAIDTMPIILSESTLAVSEEIHYPIGNLIVQNLLTMFLPIIVGIVVRRYAVNAAMKIHAILSKCAFPALILLASIFFINHIDTIQANINQLGLAILVMMLAACAIGYLIAASFSLKKQERHTIVIEVGMQNAAQAIAIASSPFVFDNEIIAIPAIIYALIMNIVLLLYVYILKPRHSYATK